MIKLTWKNLTTHPVHTTLTTLTIIINVAFVCTAYTLTNTMQNATNTLSSKAYNNTNAIMVARTTFHASQTANVTAQTPTLPTKTLEAIHATTKINITTNNITNTTQIIDHNNKPIDSGPYFNINFNTKTPNNKRLTPFHLHNNH